MRTMILQKVVSSFTLVIFSMLANTHGVAATPTLLQAKQEAEAKGYIFFTTHNEIVALAKKERKLRVSSGLAPANFKPLIHGFKQKYPFLTDIDVEEIAGVEAYQRFLLEIKSGQAKGWDVIFIPQDFGKEYMPYAMKHDILGMAKYGVLKINPGMIHPVARNILSYTTILEGVAYNRKLISDEKVPDKWEDFLKPEFTGKKFILNLRPQGVAGLVPAWGLERTLDFARKLAAQQPVWGRSATRVNTAIAAGEHSLYLGSNFPSIKRAMSKDPTGSLSYKIVEPVPLMIVGHADAILATANHPNAALLWLEFLTSPESQEIIDKYEPVKASIFTPGSVAEEVTRGKKLSVADWAHFTEFQEYVAKIVAAYGFPKAD